MVKLTVPVTRHQISQLRMDSKNQSKEKRYYNKINVNLNVQGQIV